VPDGDACLGPWQCGGAPAIDGGAGESATRAARPKPSRNKPLTSRPCPLTQADEIVVLEGGRVVQRGTFDDLMSRPEGQFALLHRTTPR
jgi:hypothetical protein